MALTAIPYEEGLDHDSRLCEASVARPLNLTTGLDPLTSRRASAPHFGRPGAAVGMLPRLLSHGGRGDVAASFSARPNWEVLQVVGAGWRRLKSLVPNFLYKNKIFFPGNIGSRQIS